MQNILPPILQREYCLRALDAHVSSYERARLELQKAQTDEQRVWAQFCIDNANGEIARWQQALEDAHE